MQALVERISENRSLTFLAWAIALLLAAALILFIFRLAFGRRLKTPAGGRARMPRLGVVDAFDLDRHRQLVIVRRDNVEHLLMIGGPNDLVDRIRNHARGGTRAALARQCAGEGGERGFAGARASRFAGADANRAAECALAA